MDEYNILRKKKSKKGGFATTAVLASLAAILLLVAIFVFLLEKINQENKTTKESNERSSSLVTDNEKKEGECNNSETCNTTVECNSKEQIFRDNLREIKDAAVSYFTNERLPQKIGQKATISLGKMQDEKLVLSVIDSNKKTCDTSKSYVEVTKEKNEYVMKINLSCSDMEDYIIIHLGCYDYCKDNICEKKNEEGITEFEYEYKKTTSCTMSDWSNWGEWTTKREKTSDLKKEDVKVETIKKSYTDTKDSIVKTTYNCDSYGSDYKLEGDKCVKRTSRKEVIDATPSDYSYNCNQYPGYTLNGTKCEKVISSKEVIDATKVDAIYTCDSSYTKVGTKCEKLVTITETRNALPNPTTYTCPNGYTKDGTKCYRMVDKKETKDANVSCPSGYTNTNGKCIYNYQEKETINATQDLDTYTCPSGYKKDDIKYVVKSGDTLQSIANLYHISIDAIKKVNNITSLSVGKTISIPAQYQTLCYKMIDKTDTVSATIVCPGTSKLNGTTCIETVGKTSSVKATPQYRDKTVYYTVTDRCRRQEGTTKNVYKCVDGNCGMYPETSYEYVWYDCPREEAVTEKEIAGYTCPNSNYSYNKKTNQCTIITYSDVNVEPESITCPTNYTRNGYQCVRNYQERQNVNASKNATTYSCPGGYTKDGTTCYRMINKTDTKDLILSCNSGFTLNNGKCIRNYQEKETINATPNPITYYCETGYTMTGNNQCVKNSQRKEIIDANVTPEKYVCKSGYTQEGTKCSKEVFSTKTEDATKVNGGYTCPSTYTLNGKKCEKTITNVDTKAANKIVNYSCASGYNKTSDNKCTKVITEENKITYYRYATRTCDGGGTDIKWSKDKNDKTLINDGYKLTGNKREIKSLDVLDK